MALVVPSPVWVCGGVGGGVWALTGLTVVVRSTAAGG